MSKRIVFLYCTQKNREDICLYENIIRVLLRKFRQSALFSYLQIDTSPPCRDRMCDLIHDETSRRGAIFLESDARNVFPCMDLLKVAFDIFASSYHISGRAVCYPEQEQKIEDSAEAVTYSKTYKKENLEKTAKLSLEMAKKQKHSLSVCLMPTNEIDTVFLSEAEIILRKEKRILSELVSIDEMISLCMKTVPSFDVVLTAKEYAELIAMHLYSMPDIPSGFIVSHGEKHKIYRRKILPYEEIGNLSHLSSLLSIAAIFENEFEMKGAANWLRRALSIAFEKKSGSKAEDFVKSVIKEIETPIRKRRAE